MALILNIDTATEYAGVCLAKDDMLLAIRESADQKNHGSFIQPAIKALMNEAGYTLSELDAIAVTAGPGSYTGLRVGLTTAKGLCFALKKPLILINTLEVMAYAVMQSVSEKNENTLFAPMIDARRMEVFTAVYDRAFNPLVTPTSMIINEDIFNSYLNDNVIYFSGNGNVKLKNYGLRSNAVFSDIQHNVSSLIHFSNASFKEKAFASLAYSEPNYLKEFFSPALKI